MRMLFRIVVLTITALFPSMASAGTMADNTRDCQIMIEHTSSQWIVTGYNPFESTPASGEFDALFVNQGDATCSFALAVDLNSETFGLSRDDTGQRVGYALVDSYSGDDLTPYAGHSRRLATRRQIVIQPHSQQVGKFRFLTNERFAGDGLYRQRIVLEAEDANGAPVAQRVITLGVMIQPQAVIGLAGAFKRVNGMADIDLGQLNPGVVPLPLMVQVRSTRAYVIAADSFNGGKLQIDNGNWSIPYSLVINGRSISASGGVYQGSARGSDGIDQLPLAFNIGETSDRAAGRYQDVITLTVSTQ